MGKRSEKKNVKILEFKNGKEKSKVQLGPDSAKARREENDKSSEPL